MKRLLLAAAVLCALASTARADLPWSTNQDAQDTWRLRRLVLPLLGTEPARLVDLNPSGSPCVLASPGSLGVPGCATPVVPDDPFAIVSNHLQLKFDSTLHLVGGQLSVNGTGGLTASAPLSFSGLNLTLGYDASFTLSGSNLQRSAITGAVTAAAGSNTTAFGLAPALGALVNPTNASAVPFYLAPTAAGQAIMSTSATTLGWADPSTVGVNPAISLFIDNDAGNDTNNCTALSTPCKTFDLGISPKVPSDGKGGSLLVSALPRSGNAIYRKSDGTTDASADVTALLSRLVNYSSVQIRGNWFTTSGVPANGGVPATGTNATGYDVTGTPTTTTWTVTLHGGGAPSLAAEPGLIGYWWRWDATTTTVALRNVRKFIVANTGTTVTASTPSSPAPSAGDWGHIEMPGLAFGGQIFANGTGATLLALSGMTVASVRVDGSSPELNLNHIVSAGVIGLNQVRALTATFNRLPSGLTALNTIGSNTLLDNYIGNLQVQGGQVATFRSYYNQLNLLSVTAPPPSLNTETTGPMTVGELSVGATNTPTRIVGFPGVKGAIISVNSNIRVGNVSFEDDGSNGVYFPIEFSGQNNSVYIDGITSGTTHCQGIIEMQPELPTTLPNIVGPSKNNSITIGPNQASLANLPIADRSADIHLSSISPLDGISRVQYTLMLDTLTYVGEVTDGNGNRFISYPANGVATVKTFSALWDPDLSPPLGPTLANDQGRFRVARASSTPGLVVLADASSTANASGIVGVNIDSLPDPVGTNFDRYGSALIVSEGIVPIFCVDSSPTVPGPVYLNQSSSYPRGVVTTVKPSSGVVVPLGWAMAVLANPFSETTQYPTTPNPNTITGSLLRVRLNEMGTFMAGDIVGTPQLNSFRPFAPLSVLARPGGTSGVPSEMSATANNQVNQMLAGTLQYHTLDLSQLTGTSNLLLDCGSNGFLVRTALGTTVCRTLTNSDGSIVFTNPDGVSGNPIINTTGLTPTSRTVQGTTPILIAGGTSAVDLSANRVWSLATNGVTNGFLAQMAAGTLKGNNTGSTANALDLTATQVTAMLNPFTSSLQGLAPSSGGGSSNFLRADGTWAAPAGTAGITALTGDGTATGPGSVAFTLNNIPNATTAAGRIDFTTITAPGTPASGKLSCFGDSTAKDWTCKNDAGTLTHGMQSLTATSHLFLTGSNADGSFTSAQPVEADVTNLVTDLAGKQATGNYITALTTDVVATGPGSASATIQANVVSNSKLAQGGALTLKGNGTNATANETDIAATAGTGAVLRESGSTLGFGALNLAASGSITGLLPLANLTPSGTNTWVLTTTGGVPVWAAPASSGANALGFYLVNQSTNAPTNAINLGALSAGLLYETVAASVATPVTLAGTTGSIPYFSSTGVPGQDNANLFWDGTNHRLGIGTASPTVPIDVLFNTNSASGFHVKNSNSGTSAQVQNQLINDAGTLAYYGIASSTFAGFAPLNGGQAFVGSSASDFSIFTQSAKSIIVYANTVESLRVSSTGNVSIGTSALATSATDRFLYLSSMAGIPSGTPTSVNSGASIPIVYDSSDDRLYRPAGASPKLIGQNDGAFASGPLCNTTTTGVHSACTAGNLATAIGMPASGQVDISAGTGSAPVGDTNFTYNTSTHVHASLGENDLGFVGVNGVSMPTNAFFVGGHTTAADRDRAQFFVGGGSLGATGTSDNTLVDIFPTSTPVRGGVTGGIYATERIRAVTYTGSGQNLGEATGLYVEAPSLSSVSAPVYAIHAAGNVLVDSSLTVGSSTGVAFLNSGTVQTTTIGAGLTLTGFTLKAQTTRRDYLLFASPAAGRSADYLPVGGAAGGSGAAVFEYPNDFLAGNIQMKGYMASNTVTAGTLTLQLTRNGSDISGALFTITSGTTAGILSISAQATGSASANDTYGAYLNTTAGFTQSGGGQNISFQVILTP